MGIQQPMPNLGQTESSLIRSRPAPAEGTSESKETKLKGGIKKKELTFKDKVKRSFVKEDLTDVRDYVIFDLVIPNLKKVFWETIVGTTAQILNINIPRGWFGGMFNNGYTNYGGGYSPNRNLSPYQQQRFDRNTITRPGINYSNPGSMGTYNRFYVSDYPFEYQEDAERVLATLRNICDLNGYVTVARFFEEADPDGRFINERNNYTNQSYGWTTFDNARIDDTDGVYTIVTVPAKPLQSIRPF